MRTLVGPQARGWRAARVFGLLASGVISCAVYDQGVVPQGDAGQAGNAASGGSGKAGSTAAGGGGSGANGGGRSGANGGGSSGANGGGSSGANGGGSLGGAGRAVGGTGGVLAGGGGAGAGSTPAAAGASGGGGENGGAPPAVTPRQLATGQPASASTSLADHLAPAANDGSQTTRWCATSAALPQWWQVDLGDTFALDSITVRWEFGNVKYSYTIEVSTDGTAFSPAIPIDAVMGPPQTNPFPLDTAGRYVRVNVTGISPENWSSLYEVTVLGH